MKCPFCGYTESKVIDSRPAEEQKLDEMELLDVLKYTPAEIEEMIASGRFQQAVHVAAWLLACRRA